MAKRVLVLSSVSIGVVVLFFIVAAFVERRSDRVEPNRRPTPSQLVEYTRSLNDLEGSPRSGELNRPAG